MKDIYNLASSLDGDTLKLSINGDIGVFDGNDSDELTTALNNNPNVSEIELELNSAGGSLFQGISMFNQLESHPANVTTIVTGVAASAASLIFMAGNKRIVRRGGFVMIHKPMSIGVNNAEEMRDKADQLDQFQSAIVDIYESKVNISRDEINNMVNNETWLNADTAIEKGFATEETEIEAEVTNKIDYCEFVNSHSSEIPEDAKKYFKNKSSIQRVLNKLKNVLNINPNEEDDMKPEEVQAMLAEKLGEQKTEFSNQLDGIKTDFQNKLTEKDELINTLNTKIVDLQNAASNATVESIVDGFINEGRIAPKDRDFEIENFKLREGKDSFESYKNSVSSRKPVVDMTQNFAHDGVDRNSTSNLDQEIENILKETGLTSESATQEEYINAAKRAGVK